MRAGRVLPKQRALFLDGRGGHTPLSERLHILQQANPTASGRRLAALATQMVNDAAEEGEPPRRVTENDIVAWRRMSNLSYKRAARRNTEHDDARIAAWRERFVRDQQPGMPAEYLTFVDEFTVALNDAPHYAWSERGRPAYVPAPERRRVVTHVIAAITWNQGPGEAAFAYVIPPVRKRALAAADRPVSQMVYPEKAHAQEFRDAMRRHNRQAKRDLGGRPLEEVFASAFPDDEVEVKAEIQEDAGDAPLLVPRTEMRPTEDLQKRWDEFRLRAWEAPRFPEARALVSRGAHGQAWALLRDHLNAQEGNLDYYPQRLGARRSGAWTDEDRDRWFARLVSHINSPTADALMLDPALDLRLLSKTQRAAFESLRVRAKAAKDLPRADRAAGMALVALRAFLARRRAKDPGGKLAELVRRAEADWGGAKAELDRAIDDDPAAIPGASAALRRQAEREMGALCLNATLTPTEKAERELRGEPPATQATTREVLEKLWTVGARFGAKGTEWEREQWLGLPTLNRIGEGTCGKPVPRGEGGVVSVAVTSERMREFLKELPKHFLVSHDGVPKTLVMDNASWHAGLGPLVARRQPEGISGAPQNRADPLGPDRWPPVVHIPPYSPEFNPIETAIGLCKRKVRDAMVRFGEKGGRSRLGVTTLIHRAMQEILPAHVRNMILCSGYRDERHTEAPPAARGHCRFELAGRYIPRAEDVWAGSGPAGSARSSRGSGSSGVMRTPPGSAPVYEGPRQLHRPAPGRKRRTEQEILEDLVAEGQAGDARVAEGRAKKARNPPPPPPESVRRALGSRGPVPLAGARKNPRRR